MKDHQKSFFFFGGLFYIYLLFASCITVFAFELLTHKLNRWHDIKIALSVYSLITSLIDLLFVSKNSITT